MKNDLTPWAPMYYISLSHDGVVLPAHELGGLLYYAVECTFACIRNAMQRR